MTRTITLAQAGPEDPFADALAGADQSLERLDIATVQLNLGKMCNLACRHCHVEAGPNRQEIMSQPVIDRILAWIDQHRQTIGMHTVDLTGGAPEMNPHFRDLVAALRHRDIHVLDRCNLTILLDPAHADLVDFLAQHHVEVVASLPCYTKENVDTQRGKGVFDDSIIALRKLNAAGFGKAESSLTLDLVYNPLGTALPPEQSTLERDYKQHLRDEFGVEFNRLWTITNMPIKRFAHMLKRDGQYQAYMNKLQDAHNPANVQAVMCRRLISVGYEGAVYDCDFNQMLAMPVHGPDGEEHTVESTSRKLWQFTPAELIDRRIRTGAHCFGCTAGAGSSCTGSFE